MKRILIAVLILMQPCPAAGGNGTTVIHREDQLALLTESAGTSAETAARQETRPGAAGTSVPNTSAEAETVTVSEAAAPVEQAPSGTKATKPVSTKATKPASTKATRPASTKATKPTGTKATKPASTKTTSAPTETTQPTQPTNTEPAPVAPELTEGDLLVAINACRQSAGLMPLVEDGGLASAAAARAAECSRYWSHTRPDGRSFETILEDFGLTGYGNPAENLLQADSTLTADVVAAFWMAAPNDRANLCAEAATRVGIGIYRGDGLLYVAAIFAEV